MNIKLQTAFVFSRADFENRTGAVHVEEGLTLDYVKIKRIADIDLSTLEGKGRLAAAKNPNMLGGPFIVGLGIPM